jgi:clan AA aspartic protease
MGYVRADIELKNPTRPELTPVQATALVDSGSLMLCLPEHIAVQLGLPTLEQREITTADGSRHLVPYVGPVQLRFEQRNCFVGALVLGDEVLLGAVPMEDMDLVVHPARQRLTVNPENPNFAHARVK